MSPGRINPWKISTYVLAIALAAVIGREIPAAEAAGPVRLSKALSALKASKKLLDEAKDPPAPFHQQSLATVTQAISAVEREIKAYEGAKAKEKGDAKGDKGDKADKADKADKGKDAKKPEAAAKKKPPADDASE